MIKLMRYNYQKIVVKTLRLGGLFLLLVDPSVAKPGGTYVLTGKEMGVADIVKKDIQQHPESYEGVDLKAYVRKFRIHNKMGQRSLKPGDTLVFPPTMASVKKGQKVEIKDEPLTAHDFKKPSNTIKFLKNAPPLDIFLGEDPGPSVSDKEERGRVDEIHHGKLPIPEYYPSQTAISRKFWKSKPPKKFPAGKWSIQKGPEGLSVAQDNGIVRWPEPVKGLHEIRMTLEAESKTIPVHWYLRVVDDDLHNTVIFSTRYIDYVVPKEYADWMRDNQYADVVDAAWEHLSDVFGCVSCKGKQIVKFAPEMGGGAHSGNPVMMGPGWWSKSPVGGWGILHITIHEVGHNFHTSTHIGYIFGAESERIEKFFHHGMPLSETALIRQIISDPKAYRMHGSKDGNYKTYAGKSSEGGIRRGLKYLEWYRLGKNPMGFPGDSYGVGVRICHELYNEFGPEALEKTMMLFRWDGIPQQMYWKAQTDEKRNAFFIGMFCVSTGRDLRKYFRRWGFECDQEFFDEILPELQLVAEGLPLPDIKGWSYCPLNGCYYRLTPWEMSFDAAQAVAESMDCHLAPVRNKEENEWLYKRYAGRGPLWIGVTDKKTEDIWRRVGGEASDYFNWRIGDPNGELCENAAVLHNTKSSTWSDANDNDSYFGIIEYNPKSAQNGKPALQQ